MKYPKLKHIMAGIVLISLMLISQVFAFQDTNQDVLSQKILLENTINQRVSDAVYRILRHENFIVNVNVVMESTPKQKYTTTYETPGAKQDAENKEANALSKSAAGGTAAPGSAQDNASGVTEQKKKTVLKKRPIKSSIPSDIPGFPGIQSPGFELYEEEVLADEEKTDDVIYAAAEDLDRVAPMNDGAIDTSVAAEAILSLDENEVITEEGVESTPASTQGQALVDYAEPESPTMARHTVASTTGPSLSVKKMELTIILEDPVSPKIIENIRTIAMVASHFNRDRGDKLQVMTADFQGGKNQKPDTEQILLKSIAEKMTAIEARQKEETENSRIKELEAEKARFEQEQINKDAQNAELIRLREQELEKQRVHEAELARIRQQEEDRIAQREEELRNLREQEENRLAEERRQMFEARQEQARKSMREDSLRLALLTEQLEDLKHQLSAVDMEEEQRLKLELEKKRREAEKSAIHDREEKLKLQMEELENQRLQASVIPENENDLLPLLLIGGAVLVALAILLGAMMGGRRRAPAAALAQDDMKPPVPTPAPAREEVEEEPEEEINHELINEVDSIKKSVVSLAVSKPGSASNIVKEWLKDAGEPEGAEGEAVEEEASNGKNKKKGK
ncbi:MAG: hypothetical protein K9N35_03015 [Candidatus Marinimicrobia bacterium]|nr:hypothetical protein [Candidatus Neomarinimicrobiota bacterium]